MINGTVKKNQMNNNRLCNDVNPFDSAHTERNSAHAFQLRGKYIFQSVPSKKNVGNGPTTMRWLLTVLCTAGFLSFIGFQIWRVVAPPQLSVDIPVDGLFTQEPQIVITGKSVAEAGVEINGQTVYLRPDGTFAQPIELQEGTNTIFIRAIKKHGLFTTVSRTIMLNSPDVIAPPISLSPTQTPDHPLN